MTTVRHPSRARRRSVLVEWVPVTDPTGRTTMEMRWHVSEDVLTPRHHAA